MAISDDTQIPASSRIAQLAKTAYFSDCYQAPLNHCKTLSEAYQAIFGYPPVWMRNLMRLRNIIAKKLGLKSFNNEEISEIELSVFRLPYQVGRRAGIFLVQEIEPHELILGVDDRHLNFKISIFIHETKGYRVVSVSTVVVIHNLLGRIYMILIKPFHRFIAGYAVKVACTSGRL
jgi:Protein of unknown function (DUF2867)